MARRFDRRRAGKSSYADVQVEFTQMVLDDLMPTIVTGGIAMVGATAILGWHYGDPFLKWLSLAMTLTIAIRAAVVMLCRKRAGLEMTAIEADRFELLYGLATCFYTSMMAISTAYNFRHHDFAAQLWCVLGTVVFCSAISARLALWPWVAQLSGLVMLAALAYSVLISSDSEVRLTSVLLLLYSWLYCESIKSKFKVVVDQIRTKRQLAVLAEHDVLTGLANRRHFEMRLKDACQQKLPFAILYIDLDKFKPINDTYGHATGDGLLREVALRLRAGLRSIDLVARLGGDEFAVLQASPVDPSAARQLAARINEQMAKPFDIFGHRLQIGASIGVQVSSDQGDDPDELVCNADKALYKVKKEGGGGFSFIGQYDKEDV